MSFSCLRTSIWRRNGHWQWTFASAWINRNFDRSLLLFLQPRNYEVQKHFLFHAHRQGIHDQIMCLIFVLLLANFRFLTKCHFERIWFLQALERFAFLQQIWSSADNNEVYINRLHYRLDSSSLDCQDFSANSPSPPLRKHRIRQFCFGRLYSITVTCRCPVDWKFVVYNLCSY